MSSAKIKLGPIVIGVNNIEKALPFYVNVFGIKVERQDESYVSAYMEDGTHIELEMENEHRFPNWKAHNVGTYKNSEFQVADMAAFLEVVTTHGGHIISPSTPRPWGGLAAEISDLDGNIFLISSPNNPQRAFANSSSFA